MPGRLIARSENDISLEPRRQTFDAAHLAPHWRGRERYVVLDTHFAAGENFLATWRAWRADPQRPQQLHYLAIESRPYTASAMAALHAAMPEHAALAQELTRAWPTLIPGFHRVFLGDDALSLTLIFADVEASVAQIDAQVDAFYLDGAALAQLPAKRSGALFTVLGRLAAQQATMAIGPALPDSALLKNSGFVCDTDAAGTRATFAPRWQVRASRLVPVAARHAIVIGAGVAGAAAAERLTARGWRVSLLERHHQAAQEGSGNAAGIAMPMLASDDNPGARLTQAAFLFALRLWQRLGGVGRAFPGEACGALQLARDAARAEVARKIAAAQRFPAEFAQWLEADQVAAFPGMPTCVAGANHGHGGWLFPQAGWVNPGGVCAALLAACGDKLDKFYGCHVARIERAGELWQVFDERGLMIASAPHVIVANGVGFRSILHSAPLPLASVRGQVTWLPAESMPALPLVLCGAGYLTRPFDGVCVLGATYDMDDDPALRMDSQRENLARLAQMLPQFAAGSEEWPLSGRVGFRCVSPDRLPMVGALPDYAALAHFRGERLRDVPRLPGMHGLLGYASRGMIWAPLAAELLAAQINGEPLPLERDLVATLDPARFALKTCRRAHAAP
jgi:tRNA 5-methylaminomethyl-2-thiouridine biosynthesis bifunctional protein